MTSKETLKLARAHPEFCDQYAGPPDEYGFNLETYSRCEPFFYFMYKQFFGTETLGCENIPNSGRALLVGNHSGGLFPFDAFMLAMATLHLHSHPRRIRFLSLECLRVTPNVRDVVCGMGAVPATMDVATKLLSNDELVCFYPEGRRGPSKTYFQRYQLQSFNSGFVKAAIATNSPIIPVSTVGGDEIYPVLASLKSIATLIQAPYYPLTLTFPWLPFPLSFIPLPIKWLIKIGKPIHLNYPADRAGDRKLVRAIAQEIRNDIQKDLSDLVGKRKSPFTGWNIDDLRSDA